MKDQLVTISGDCETRNIRDLLPGILNQVGPQQFRALQSIIKDAGVKAEDDAVPDLVGNFDDV